jgi:hypothetical protein
MDEMNIDSQDIALETPADDVFRAPSIHSTSILNGASYAHYSAIPKTIADEMTTECVLGVDEAGRGPVLGISKAQQQQTSWFVPRFLLTRQRTDGIRTLLPTSLDAPLPPCRNTPL